MNWSDVREYGRGYPAGDDLDVAYMHAILDAERLLAPGSFYTLKTHPKGLSVGWYSHTAMTDGLRTPQKTA
jgi:hypothetical protein